jgi:hypothetical protein
MKWLKRRRARKARPFQQAIADNQTSAISKRLRLKLLKLHIQEATPK